MHPAPLPPPLPVPPTGLAAPPPLLPPLPRLPLLLVGAVLLLPLLLAGLILLARFAVPTGPLAAQLARLKTAPLKGMQNDAPPPAWSVANMLSGAWQRDAEAWWNMHLPLRGPAVRATNQVYYSLLRKTYMYQGRIVIGREQTLFDLGTPVRYCNLDNQTFTAAQFDQWAAGLRELQDYFERRGQAFIYLLSPAKTSLRARFLPPLPGCADPPRPDYRLAVAALARAGVRSLDGSALMQAASARHAPELLFARGGLHWTMLGAALTMQELARVAQRPGGAPLPAPVFSYRVARQPLGTDSDLLDLLNLWRPDRDYAVPVLHIEPAARPAGHAPRLAMVGTSFMVTQLELSARWGGYSHVDHYYYFSLGHFRVADYAWAAYPGSFVPPENYDALFAADLVIVEENEAALRSEHLRRLRAMLGMAPAGPAAK